MALLLGFDAGGTQTRAVVADTRAKRLTMGIGGPGNPHNISEREWQANMRNAAGRALRAMGKASGLDAVFAGVAGIKSPRDEKALAGKLAEALELPEDRVRARNDAVSALAGGLGGRPGLVLIAGTGSHVYGRNEAGRETWCGGWGWLMDDVGSGFYLGHKALRLAVRTRDGRAPQSSLADALFENLAPDHPFELLSHVYNEAFSPAWVASLAKLVVEHGEKGDAQAMRLLEQGAAELAGVVQTATKNLGFTASPALALVGGLTTAGTLYRQLLEKALAQTTPPPIVRLPEYPPVFGSILLAAEIAGVDQRPLLSMLRESELTTNNETP